MPNAGAIRAGQAFVEITTDNAALERGLRAAQARLRAFGAGLKEIGAPLAAIGGAVAGALLGATKGFAAMGDTVEKMSRRTGVSVEALSELGFAAEQSGADLDTLETGLRKMQRTVADAAVGSGAAAEALSRLGLGVQDVVQLSPEQQFKLIADRLSGVADPTQRAALAMELFGESGTRLLPMLEGGARGLEALQARARALGLTISAETARDAAKLNDELNILWRVVKQGVFAVGSALAPTVSELVNKIVVVTIAATEWIKQNRELLGTILKVSLAVAAVGGGLVMLGTLCSAAALAMKALALGVAAYRSVALGAAGATAALNAALTFLSRNPKVAIAAIAASVAAIGAAAYLSRSEVDKLASSLGMATTGGGGVAVVPEVGIGAEGGENWARKVHQLRLQQIEDEHARAAALIRERYDYELSEAKRAGAELSTLTTIAEAEHLELTRVAVEASRKTQDERERFEHELAVVRIELIEDVAERERALIEENFRYRAAHAAAPERASLEALRAAELEVAAAREAARQRAASEAISARDADRRWEIAELELRTRYKGVELERQLLDLQERRALVTAEAAGESLDLVRREFELRRQLASAKEAVASAARSSVSGTFNAAVLFGLAGGGRTQERIARATEDTARDVRRIRERGGLTFTES